MVGPVPEEDAENGDAQEPSEKQPSPGADQVVGQGEVSEPHDASGRSQAMEYTLAEPVDVAAVSNARGFGPMSQADFAVPAKPRPKLRWETKPTDDPTWVRLLAKILGVSRKNFDRFRDVLYVVQLNENERIVVNIDGIRENLLSGRIGLDSRTIRLEDYAGLDEGSPVSAPSDASDEAVLRLLKAADPNAAGHKPQKKSSPKERPTWQRIRDGIGKQKFSIRVLHQPLMAHVDTGAHYGFFISLGLALGLAFLLSVIATLFAPEEPSSPGAPQNPGVVGMVGVWGFFLLVLPCLILVCSSVQFSPRLQHPLFAPIALVAGLLALGGMLVLFIFALPFIIAALSGAVVASVIGFVVGVARLPKLKGLPRSDGREPSAASRKPWHMTAAVGAVLAVVCVAGAGVVWLPSLFRAKPPLPATSADGTSQSPPIAESVPAASSPPQVVESEKSNSAGDDAASSAGVANDSKHDSGAPQSQPVSSDPTERTDERNVPAFTPREPREPDDSTAVDGALRVWTDATGRYKTRAVLIESDGTQVRLKRDDGSEITVSLSKLSEADRQYVRSRGSK